MPILNVRIGQPAGTALTHAVSETPLELTTRILREKRELTAIAIDCVPPGHWIVGGRSLVEQRENCFYFDIKVVDGTNTRNEKPNTVPRHFQRSAALLGNAHEESYNPRAGCAGASLRFWRPDPGIPLHQGQNLKPKTGLPPAYLDRRVRLSKATGSSPTSTSASAGRAASPSRSSRASW